MAITSKNAAAGTSAVKDARAALRAANDRVPAGVADIAQGVRDVPVSNPRVSESGVPRPANDVGKLTLRGLPGEMAAGLINLAVLPIAVLTQIIPQVLGFLGEKSGSKRIQSWAAGATNKFDKPFARLLGAPLTFTGWVGRKTGLASLTNFAEGTKSAVFNHTSNTAEAVGGTIQTGVNAVVGKKRMAAHVARLQSAAQTSHTEALGLLGKIEATLAEHTPVGTEVSAGVSEAREALQQGAGHFTSEHIKALTEHLREQVSGSGMENPGFVTNTFGKIKTILGIGGSAEAKALAGVSKDVDNFQKLAFRAHDLNSKALFRSDMGAFLKGAPTRVSAMRLSQVAESGIFWGGAASMGYGGVHALSDPLKVMKATYAQITGKQATNGDLFSSKAPEVVKQMRKEYLLHAPAHAALNIAGIAGWAMTRRFSGGGFFSPMNLMAGFGQFTDSIFGKLDKTTLLGAMTETQMAFQAQGELPPGAYAALIMRANPTVIQNLGGIDNPQVLQLLRQYATDKVPPGQVLAALEKNGAGVKAQIAALPPAAPQEAASQAESPSTAWRDTVTKNASPSVAPKAVLGNWTAQAANDTQPAAGQGRA